MVIDPPLPLSSSGVAGATAVTGAYRLDSGIPCRQEEI